jgi:hypothetical protein
VALRAACQPTGRTSTEFYHHLDQLPRGEAAIRFQLPAIGGLQDGQEQAFAPVLALFFQLCIVGEPEKSMAVRHAYSPPHATPPPQAAPAGVEKFGEYYIPPSPVPLLMSPETMTAPAFSDPWQTEPPASPNPHRLRAISDIRPVLVEFA